MGYTLLYKRRFIFDHKKMLPSANIPNLLNPLPIPGKPGGLPIPLKHDFPPYLQMLFSARGRLPYVKPMPKNKNRSYDPVILPESTIYERFENQSDPPPKPKVLSKKEL